jgi:hypothetical protein
MNDELEKIRKETFVAIEDPGICLEWPREIAKELIIVGVPADIPTQSFPNVSVERYRCTILLGGPV